ncbi:MAG TPA: DUF5666 domain-containing protein [Candidatus Paceibacterota bacterium]|nr:DUF5666 domain-containing protein [Candidatus Paceibacterota bacterium]
MKKIWVVVIAVACAGVAFFGVTMYGKSMTATGGRSGFGAFASSTRAFGRGTGTAGGGFAMGQIVAADAESITVQLPNGNSEVVFYSSSTQIEKPTLVSSSALTNGEQVVVTGSQNSDGSVTAQSIQVRPTNGGGFPQGGGR